MPQASPSDSSWTLRGMRSQVPTPGTNRQVTVFGAIEVTAGAWAYRLGRRCAADFIASLQMLAQAYPRAPVVVVISDNDSIHHARERRLPQRCLTASFYGTRLSRLSGRGPRRWVPGDVRGLRDAALRGDEWLDQCPPVLPGLIDDYRQLIERALVS
jgi:hypothetical protein